jgi:hypothetical protein
MKCPIKVGSCSPQLIDLLSLISFSFLDTLQLFWWLVWTVNSLQYLSGILFVPFCHVSVWLLFRSLVWKCLFYFINIRIFYFINIRIIIIKLCSNAIPLFKNFDNLQVSVAWLNLIRPHKMSSPILIMKLVILFSLQSESQCNLYQWGFVNTKKWII